MVLALSKEKVGTPSTPTAWSNEKQTHIPINYKESFLRGLKEITLDPNCGYEKRGEMAAALKYMCDTIDMEAQHYHANYMSYLEKCWADHLGVVITPDIVWYTLLCEVAAMVKTAPNSFRSLFTKSDKKEDIIVFSDSVIVMPLDTLTAALKEKVPTDTDSFFPEFSTRTPRSFHAFQAAFCDMCSPFYNYMMYCCNIPMVDVRGTMDDWKTLEDKWRALAKIIGASAWTKKVSEVLASLVQNFSDKEFWKKIFAIKHCGSGGQIEVFGWFTDLFQVQPQVRYVENYSPHVSMVKYKQLNLGQDFEMSVGIFGSKMENEFLVPDFSYVVHEKTK